MKVHVEGWYNDEDRMLVVDFEENGERIRTATRVDQFAIFYEDDIRKEVYSQFLKEFFKHLDKRKGAHR